MPSYTMRNTETDEYFTEVMSIEERNLFLERNPEWTQVLSAPRIVSGVGGVLSKTPDAWKDVLKEMKKNSGRNNIHV